MSHVFTGKGSCTAPAGLEDSHFCVCLEPWQRLSLDLLERGSPCSRNAGQGVEEELEEEEEQEEDDIEEIDQEAQVKEAAATTRPKAQAAPPEPVKSTRPKPAPAPRREERASEQGSETAEASKLGSIAWKSADLE